MKSFFLLILLFFCLPNLNAQSTGKPSAAEAKEMNDAIADLRKEVAELEAKIKIAEKEDPDEASSLKSELATLKSMLASMEKIASPTSSAKIPSKSAPKSIPLSPSPLTPITLKTPVVAPTAAQASDYYF